MLNNSGTYGPHGASDNMVTSINGSQSKCSDSTNNLNNFSKLAHQGDSNASSNYEAHNFPYFGQPPMNIPLQPHPFQAYQSVGQSSSYFPQNSPYSGENCSNNYLPYTNPHPSQYMMNFPQNFPMKRLSEPERPYEKESRETINYPINIPQIPSKIFQMNDSLSKKVFTNPENEYDSIKSMQISTEACDLSNSNSNDYITPEDLSLDVKTSCEKVMPCDIDDIDEHKNSLQKTLVNSPPSQSPDKNDVITPVNSHFPLITERKRKSLEKTVRLIESILTKAINNNTKEVVNSTVKDPLACSPAPSDNLIVEEKETDSDDEVLIKKVPLKRKIGVKIKKEKKSSVDKSPIRKSPVDKLHAENKDLLHQPIKQEIADVNIKVEHVSWPDIDYAYPFHRDSNGTIKDCIDDTKIVSKENSVQEALNRIKSGETSTSYYECPHCSLLLTHPKRFLVHTKWHTFGLLNEQRAEVIREQEDKQVSGAEGLSAAEAANCDAKTFPCKDCDKVFISKGSMRSHRRKCHIYDQTQCRVCLLTFSGQAALRSHMASHEQAGAHQCPRCPKRFKFRHSLAKHADTHLEKTHGCPECSKMFGSVQLVKMHMKVHERAARGTTYHCSYCGKGFYETYNLNVHERTHRNDKPFKCDICESRFVTNSSLTRHMKVSHSGAKPHTCKVCQKCFATEAIRDRHELRVHTDQRQFRYQCRLCPRRYMKPKDLKNHAYKMHTGQKKIAVGEDDPNVLPDDVE